MKKTPSSTLLALSILLVVCIALAGCETTPQSGPASRQQAEADLVINFQSWNSISFIKPDVTSTAGSLTAHTKTFTRNAFVKLLSNLKIPRRFVVVVLDRRYSPDPQSLWAGWTKSSSSSRDWAFAGSPYRTVRAEIAMAASQS